MTSDSKQAAPRRNRAIRLAVATSLVSKAGMALLQLVSIPIALRVLGLEVFGIYSTIAVAITAVILMQVGIGPALTHGISRAVADGNATREKQYFVTASFIVAGLAVLAGTIVAVILLTVPIPTLFGADYAKHAEIMRPALWLGLGIILVQFLLSVTERAREGFLEVNINNIWGALGNVLGAVSLGVGIWFFPTIEWLLLCVFGSNALAKAGNTVHFFLKRPYLLPRPRFFRKKFARELFTDGLAYSAAFYAPPLVEFNGCAFIIGHLLGPATVGIYNILFQMQGILLGLIMMVTTPTWPAIVDAAARHDCSWIRLTARRLRLLWLALGGATLVGLVGLGPIVIPLWLGPEVEIPRLTLAAFAGFFLAASWTHLNQSLLLGMGKVRSAAVFVILESAIILGPATLGLFYFGLPGLLAGLLVTKVAVTGIQFPRLFAKALAQHREAAPSPPTPGPSAPGDFLANEGSPT